MNNNNDLTKTEKLIISLLTILGLSALYAVGAYITIFIFSVLFGTPNMMVAQFVPMFILNLLFINDIVDFKDDNKEN